MTQITEKELREELSAKDLWDGLQHNSLSDIAIAIVDMFGEKESKELIKHIIIEIEK